MDSCNGKKYILENIFSILSIFCLGICVGCIYYKVRYFINNDFIFFDNFGSILSLLISSIFLILFFICFKRDVPIYSYLVLFFIPFLTITYLVDFIFDQNVYNVIVLLLISLFSGCFIFVKWIGSLFLTNKNNEDSGNVVSLLQIYENNIKSDYFYVIDQAIDSEKLDLFDFSSIVDNLMLFIENCNPSSRSYVLGFVGPWGSGKTSVLNIVKNKLNKDNYKILFFSPWEYNNYVDALEGLCNLIFNEVKRLDFDFIFFKYKRVLKKALDKKIGFNFFDDYSDTIKELKDLINKNFFNKGIKYIIVIDDLDRIVPGKVCPFLSYLYNFLDFRNCIYVLCYDENTIKIKYGNYLDKIINSKLYVPYLDTTNSRFVYEKIIINLFKKYGISGIKSHVIQYVTDDIDNIREFIRFINSFILNINIINKYNLNPNEFLLIEFLKFKYYHFYDYIYNNKEIFTGMCEYTNQDISKAKLFIEHNSSFFRELFNKYANFKDIFVYLFPSDCYFQYLDINIPRSLEYYSSISDINILKLYYSLVKNNGVDCSIIIIDILNKADKLSVDDLFSFLKKLESFDSHFIILNLKKYLYSIYSFNIYLKIFNAFAILIKEKEITKLNISDLYDILFDILISKQFKLDMSEFSETLLIIESYDSMLFNKKLFFSLRNNYSLYVTSEMDSTFKRLLKIYFDNKKKENIFKKNNFNPFLLYSLSKYLDISKTETVMKYYKNYLNKTNVFRILFNVMSYYVSDSDKFVIRKFDNELNLKDYYSDKYSIVSDFIREVNKIIYSINSLKLTSNQKDILKMFNIISKDLEDDLVIQIDMDNLDI